MATVKPIFRIFDYDKAIAFYVDWLGFQIDWQYRADESPVYMQLSLGDIVLHLSEHHGDGSPGARAFIDDFQDLAAYHKKLLEKNYKYNRPGIDAPFYDPDALEVSVTDPFSNSLIFVERNVKRQ